MDEQPLPFGQETIMQEWRRWLSFVLAGTLSLAVSWTHAASVDPITKCQSAKLRAASREIAGKMKCEATASATGMPVDACLASAAGKADTAYSKAGTACVGDAGALHGAVDTCVATLVADVPGSGKCPAASVKAVGRGAGAHLRGGCP